MALIAEQLDTDTARPTVCRHGGCAVPADTSGLCPAHQAAQDRLRERADQRSPVHADPGRILGGLTANLGPWRSHAACRGMDPALFVPLPSKHNRKRTTDELAPAIAVCRECPVRPECLAHALDAGEHGAVWGGEYMSDRRVRQLRAERQGMTA